MGSDRAINPMVTIARMSVVNLMALCFLNYELSSVQFLYLFLQCHLIECLNGNGSSSECAQQISWQSAHYINHNLLCSNVILCPDGGTRGKVRRSPESFTENTRFIHWVP